MEKNKIYLGDCLELMPKHIEDKSVDMIFCDLPYGTTQNKWDSVIDLDKLWTEYKRVIKDNGAIVLFGAEPFSSSLRISNIKDYKYDWIWEKSKPTGHLNAKKQPLRKTELISVFYKKQCLYKPQGTTPTNKIVSRTNRGNYGECSKTTRQTVTNYPRNIIKFNSVDGVHQTQKPLDLIEYMIKTYTNEGDLILDNTCGSGTTGRGAKNLNRDYIMMEQDETYYEIACKRLED
tara:strand:- start:64 stop:762 length:699 start_codon:yes stop_codon:yes gene_type:complete